MTIRRIRIYGDPVLHSPARRVTAFDSGLRDLVTDMFDTMYAGGGVGLAANQIGADLRAFVYDCMDAEGNWHAGTVVNPVLRTSPVPRRAPDPEADMEGCMSAPLDESFPVVRAEWAVVTGSDADGNAVEVAASGDLARCFQHETDHLDGRLYLDRLTGEYAAEARARAVARGWGVPGNTWLPKAPGGEPAHVGRDSPLRRDAERGPISPGHVRIPVGITLQPAV